VRLVDTVFRQGHLSEQALVEALMTGERPLHLDRCDVCGDRAVAISRWLDDVRTLGVEAADEVFSPEQLAAQQTQIMKRLEQLDQPARVIAFPSQSRREQRDAGGRRVAVSWVGVAAAAGLAIGVIGGQLSARLTGGQATPAQIVQSQGAVFPTSQETPIRPEDKMLLDQNFDTVNIKAFEAVDEMTPRMSAARFGG